MKSTVTEMKNTLDGISSVVTEAGRQICELKGRTVRITAGNRIRTKRDEDSPRCFQDNGKCTSTPITGVPEEEREDREERERGERERQRETERDRKRDRERERGEERERKRGKEREGERERKGLKKYMER